MASPLSLLQGGAWDPDNDDEMSGLYRPEGSEPELEAAYAAEAPALRSAAAGQMRMSGRSPYADQASKLIGAGLSALGDPSQQMDADRSALRAQQEAITRKPSAFDNPLLRMGLEMMVSASKPGATLLGSVGAGGKEALSFQEKQAQAEELRKLKMAQIEREVARLPYTYGKEQLELGAKLGSLKAPNPFVAAGRYGMFDTEKGQYIPPSPEVQAMGGGNKRIFGSSESGYFLFDPANPQKPQQVVAPRDPNQDPRVLARLREQFIKMAEPYGWASIEDKNAWVEANVLAASRGMGNAVPSPVAVGAKPPAQGAVPGEPAPGRPQPTLSPTEKAGAIKESEADAAAAVKTWDELRASAQAASGVRSQIGTIRAIDADTGRLAPMVEAVGGWAEAVGAKPDMSLVRKATDLQKMNSVLESMVLDLQQDQKGVQTEGDAQRMRTTLSKITNTKEANDFILRAMDAQAAAKQLRRQYAMDAFDKGSTRRQSLDQWDKMLDKDSSFLIKEYKGKPIFLNEFLERMRSVPDYQKIPESEFNRKALNTWRGLQ